LWTKALSVMPSQLWRIRGPACLGPRRGLGKPSCSKVPSSEALRCRAIRDECITRQQAGPRTIRQPSFSAGDVACSYYLHRLDWPSYLNSGWCSSPGCRKDWCRLRSFLKLRNWWSLNLRSIPNCCCPAHHRCRRSRRQIGENDSGGALDAHGPSVGRMASPVHPLRSSSIMRCERRSKSHPNLCYLR